MSKQWIAQDRIPENLIKFNKREKPDLVSKNANVFLDSETLILFNTIHQIRVVVVSNKTQTNKHFKFLFDLAEPAVFWMESGCVCSVLSVWAKDNNRVVFSVM